MILNKPSMKNSANYDKFLFAWRIIIVISTAHAYLINAINHIIEESTLKSITVMIRNPNTLSLRVHRFRRWKKQYENLRVEINKV
jgi:hypothetical protein